MRGRPAPGSGRGLRGRIADSLGSPLSKPIGLVRPESDERAFTVNIRQPVADRQPRTQKPVAAE